MKVNVADIKLEPGLHKTVPVQAALEPFEMGGQVFHFDRPFEGDAEIWNAGEGLLVKVYVSGEALVQCSRCLAPFGLPLEVSFDEMFIEGEPGDEDEDDEEFEDDRTVTYFTGDEIDLSDAIRENLLLELPMKPLCDEECKGLCPSCGQNLNESTCSCEAQKSADTRLEVLRDLLNKPDSNS